MTPADLYRLERFLQEQFHHINHRIDRIMATLQELQDAVAAEDTVIDSAITLIQGLAQQVADLKPTQAAIDKLAADIKAKSDALAAAVTSGTPAA